MEFGVPKEIRECESRVALTPSGVLSLMRRGHTVYVQAGAGEAAGFRDDEYIEAGAVIVYTAAEAYGRADTVVKVTRPTAKEHHLFRMGQAILSFLYLPVASSDLLHACREKEITAIAYEMIQEDDYTFPVLLPTSEVAGRLAPVIAGRLLMNDRGGRGVLLNGIPGVPPAAVVVLGAGVLGTNAVRAFLGVGAQVTVLDRDLRRLHQLDDCFSGRVSTMLSNHHNLTRAVAFADVLMGAVQTPGSRSDVIVSREMVRGMSNGSVVIDFSVNNGGCIETSRPTSLANPTYMAEGVIHYCVPNVASNVARTGSYAINNAVLPYLRTLGDEGMVGILQASPALARGINVYQGKLVHPDVAAALGVPLDMENLPGVRA